MARAEEERRRHALEERRKTQQQATDRFRNAIYRNFRPIATNKPLKSSSVESKYSLVLQALLVFL